MAATAIRKTGASGSDESKSKGSGHRTKMPLDHGAINKDTIADKIIEGIGARRLALITKSWDKLLDYDFTKKGDDRDSLHENCCLVQALLEINGTGVWQPKLFDKALLEVERRYNGKLLSGHGATYLDHLSSVLQRLFVDLGVLRRRQKHQCTKYAGWLEKLLEMVDVTDNADEIRNEISDLKAEKIAALAEYYEKRPPKPATSPLRGKKNKRPLLQRISEVSSNPSQLSQGQVSTKFFPPMAPTSLDPPEEYDGRTLQFDVDADMLRVSLG